MNKLAFDSNEDCIAAIDAEMAAVEQKRRYNAKRAKLRYKPNPRQPVIPTERMLEARGAFHAAFRAYCGSGRPYSVAKRDAVRVAYDHILLVCSHLSPQELHQFVKTDGMGTKAWRRVCAGYYWTKR